MAFKLQSAKQIGVLVDTAITHTVKGDEIVHTAAIQCLAHAAKHGDTTLMDRLVKGVGKSVRRQALILWIHDFSPIRWNGDGEVGQASAKIKRDGKEVDNPNFRPYDVEKANATPFYDYAPGAERTARPLSFDGLYDVVTGLKGKIARATKQGGAGFEGDLEEAKRFADAVASFAKGWLDQNRYEAEPEEAEEGVAPPAPAPRRARQSAVQQVAAVH
jgi:hypothetical protein